MKTAVRMSLPQCTLLQFCPEFFLPNRSATRDKSLLQTQQTCLHSNYIEHFRQKTHFSTTSFGGKFNPVMWCYYSCLFFWLASFLQHQRFICFCLSLAWAEIASKMYWVFTYNLHIHSSFFKAWDIMPNASLSAFIHLVSSPLNRSASDQSK